MLTKPATWSSTRNQNNRPGSAAAKNAIENSQFRLGAIRRKQAGSGEGGNLAHLRQGNNVNITGCRHFAVNR
jgi:hypothetical protein